mmetsp:Transcript_35314/g.81833  ORF Transcript_35314/g.81833 Transcript_35314/m.81833 type:complete len:214 (+) Transcript_35314:75-716(+)
MAAVPAPPEKKVRPGPPKPSAAVMTASVVIRGALAAVLGQKLGGVCAAVVPIPSEGPGVAKLQMTWKGSAREAEIKKASDVEHEALLRGVEAAANRAIEADLPVVRIAFPDAAAAVAALGDAAEDEAPTGKAAKKGKDKKKGKGEGGEAPAAKEEAAADAKAAADPPADAKATADPPADAKAEEAPAEEAPAEEAPAEAAAPAEEAAAPAEKS